MIDHLHNFLTEWIESWKTYYLSYIIAFFAAIIWIIIIYYGEDSGVLYELLATCGIAFPLFLLTPLSLQLRKKTNTTLVIVGPLLVTLLSVLFAFYVWQYHVFDYPSLETHSIVTILSYCIAWGSVFGVIASVFPRNNLSLRWWWKELVSHTFLAWLGSLILRGGISASLGSIDYLFDINISYKRYLYVGVVSLILIGVSIFLTKLHKTEVTTSYENFLRFFGLYIFFPLAIIYALILLTYGLKIVITWQWPKGLISMMVVGYTLRGLASYLLTYPLESLWNWKKRIQSSYFLSILVFVFLLLGAIGVRVSQYGITEHRYLILMIAVWILVVSITSLLWPQRSLRTMIFTFLWLCISSAYLPRGAWPVALESQSKHFLSLAQQAWFYENNAVLWKKTDADTLNKEQIASLSRLASVWSYIEQYYGIEELRALYGQAQGKNILYKPEGYYRLEHETIFLSLGLTGNFSELYQYSDGILFPEETETNYFSFYSDNEWQLITIEPYHYSLTLSVGEYMDKESNTQEMGSIVSDDGMVRISFSGPHNMFLTVQQQGQEEISLDINDLAQELYQQSFQQKNNLYRHDGERYALIIDNASGRKGKDKTMIESAHITLLIK